LNVAVGHGRVRVSIRIRVMVYNKRKVIALQMLNDKLHYGKINYTYTLVSSGGHTHVATYYHAHGR